MPDLNQYSSFSAESKKIILKNKDFTPFFYGENFFFIFVQFLRQNSFCLASSIFNGQMFYYFFQRNAKNAGKNVVENFIFTFLKCIPTVNHESDLHAKSQKKASKMKVWLFPFLNYL